MAKIFGRLGFQTLPPSPSPAFKTTLSALSTLLTLSTDVTYVTHATHATHVTCPQVLAQASNVGRLPSYHAPPHHIYNAFSKDTMAEPSNNPIIDWRKSSAPAVQQALVKVTGQKKWGNPYSWKFYLVSTNLLRILVQYCR